jgi:FkbM family methyltransferase
MLVNAKILSQYQTRVRCEDFQLELPNEDISILPALQKYEMYEPHIQTLFCEIIKNTWTVLDVGANFGQHTVLLSKLAKEVIAIEASLNNAQFLVANIDINKCENVYPICIGAWSEKTILTFNENENGGAASHLGNLPGAKTYHSLDIAVDTLDGTLDHYVELSGINVDFIKMDIEGAELFALKGATKLLSTFPPILIELNNHCSKNFFGYETIEVVRYLQNLGYNKLRCFSKTLQWIEISENELVEYFNDGHLMIDVFFTKENE